MPADAKGLYAAIGTLKGAFPVPPEVQTLTLLLHLGVHGESSMSDLQQVMGLGSSAMSRQVGLLGTTGYRNGPAQSEVPGIGLVETWEDPLDRRQKRVKLTSKGRALITKALKHIGD